MHWIPLSNTLNIRIFHDLMIHDLVLSWPCRIHLLAHLQQLHGSSESGMSSRCFTERLVPSYARRLGSLVIAMSLSLWRGKRVRCLCRESLRANSSPQDVQGYFLLGSAAPMKIYDWILNYSTNRSAKKHCFPIVNPKPSK